MKTIFFKKLISTVIAVSMSICNLSMITSVAETEELYTLTYNLDGGISETEFESVTLKSGGFTYIPEGTLEKEGYYFSGWTYNNYLMYEEGDTFLMPAEDITLSPVWVDASDEVFRKVSYDDEGCQIMGVLEGATTIAGRCFEITKDIVLKDGYEQLAWTDGEHIFQKYQKMIVPNHDVVLSPVWYAIHNIYYQAGDVDNIVGGSSVPFEKTTSMSFELADSGRLSRLGYNISGWECSTDGLIYDTGATFVMPDSDVYFTAVWKPLEYDVKFSASTKNYTIIEAKYGDTITVPECEFTKSGYTFGGWTYEDTTYQPGEQFEIPALVKGKKIIFGCNWIKDSEVTTTEPTTEVPTTTEPATDDNPPDNIAKAVALSQYLLCKTEINETEKDSFDFNNDGFINVFDLIMLKYHLKG